MPQRKNKTAHCNIFIIAIASKVVKDLICSLLSVAEHKSLKATVPDFRYKIKKNFFTIVACYKLLNVSPQHAEAASEPSSTAIFHWIP